MDLRAIFAKTTSTTTDLLVSYPGKQYGRARNEILRLLRRFGDPAPWVEKSSVSGMAVVHATRSNREEIFAPLARGAPPASRYDSGPRGTPGV